MCLLKADGPWLSYTDRWVSYGPVLPMRSGRLAQLGKMLGQNKTTQGKGEAMPKSIQKWLDERLDEEQNLKRCLTPSTRQERDRLRAECARGSIIEVYPHLYARESYWDGLDRADQQLHMMRTLQSLHPDWVFAGPSAAVIHGLVASHAQLKSIWTACSRRQHQKPTKSKRSIIVTNDQPVSINGLTCTSFMRTSSDCMRIAPFRNSLAVADSALRIKSITQAGLIEGIRRACPKAKGLVHMRSTISLADARAESGGESVARAIMLELGVAPPDLQRIFAAPSPNRGLYRVDFAWDLADGVLIGELDGHEKYTNAQMRGDKSLVQVIDEEHRRQTQLESIPEILRVIRFGYADLFNDSEFLALLMAGGVPRTFTYDDRVIAAGGTLRCR